MGGDTPGLVGEEHHAQRVAQTVSSARGNQREETMDRQWETRRRVRAHGNGNRDGERDSVSGVSNE